MRTKTIDEQFIDLTTEEPGPDRTRRIKLFAEFYWNQLSEKHRIAYRKSNIDPFPNIISEHDWLNSESAYNVGMAKQDRLMIDF